MPNNCSEADDLSHNLKIEKYRSTSVLRVIGSSPLLVAYREHNNVSSDMASLFISCLEDYSFVSLKKASITCNTPRGILI
jgi:hypothetical protein